MSIQPVRHWTSNRRLRFLPSGKAALPLLRYLHCLPVNSARRSFIFLKTGSRWGIVLFVLFFSHGRGIAAESSFQPWFNAGNLHYREGNYQAAIDEYLKITGAGVANEWVFFNLGNAYYKENRTGNAILYYEKALRLAPGDSQIRENLALARSRTIDKLSSPAEPFGLRLVKWFFIRLTIDQETALALVLFVAANLLFSLVFIRKPDPVRRWLLAVCLAFSFLTLLFFASNVLRIQHEIRHVFAIVLVEKADVQSGPEADNALLFSIHEGAKVEIREELGEWVQIGLENGWAGWMPRKALSMI